ncbi:uncharacterized protein BKCO1_4400014 [Diplodia corticola]|uniref:Uncharacterized protein n=1 Tax=Diplodia corticola TaxID=236234 RepID=A0A1J9RGU4_9PEZI|nr:uncharacterized protein BKCO1_4400014 [Diplodia corticola]OJD31763.1 hypothetical protein BKCO1_4400014 [Diplodia corticola]
MIRAAAAFLLLMPYIASAIPISPDSVDTASVLLCTDVNYTGTCTSYPTLLGNDNCNSIDSDSSTVKSIKTDDGLDCIFYSYVSISSQVPSSSSPIMPTKRHHSNGVCRTFFDPSTESLTVRAPGNADLGAISGWIQPLLSYECVSVKATEFASHLQALDAEDKKEKASDMSGSPSVIRGFGVEAGVSSR